MRFTLSLAFVALFIVMSTFPAFAQTEEHAELHGVDKKIDPVCSQTDVYGCYTNHKYGYLVAWPVQYLTPMPESDAGDGRVFVSTDGKSELIAWGEYSDVLEQTLAETYERALEQSGEQVTYKHFEKDYFVISGYKDGRIFYHKTLRSQMSRQPSKSPMILILKRHSTPS